MLFFIFQVIVVRLLDFTTREPRQALDLLSVHTKEAITDPKVLENIEV